MTLLGTSLKKKSFKLLFRPRKAISIQKKSQKQEMVRDSRENF